MEMPRESGVRETVHAKDSDKTQSADLSSTNQEEENRDESEEPRGLKWLSSRIKAVTFIQDQLRGIAKVTDIGVSKDPNSFPDENGILRLEERMKLHHLERLKDYFSNHQPSATLVNGSSVYSPPKYHFREPGLLTLQEFKDAIAQVLNTHEYDNQLDTLFTKLDMACDGYVDWNEFCTYMLLQYRENDYMRTKNVIPFRQEARVRHIVFNRQETTTKVISVDNPVKYVTVSKEGAICVWDTLLHLERHYSLSEAEEDPRGLKRRFKTWVTDAVYMPNVHRIAICSTSRDIRFFDATSSSQYYEEFHLYSLPDVPYSLTYWYDPKNPSGESMLFYGDDRGGMNIFTFLRPTVQLFATPYKAEEGVSKIYYQDLQNHIKWITYTNFPGVHDDIIRKVQYMPENNCVLSSCGSPRNTVVILDLFRKKKNYMFHISKGVECFDYNKNLNLLVTGSSDHVVRVWNTYVTSKPVAVLHGHAVGVVDCVIHEKLGQTFTYSRDATLKVWDLKEHVCLQTINVKFPISIHGRMPEHGPFSLHLQPPPQNCLIITSNDYIAQLKLGQEGPPVSLTPVTHLTQLCAAIYNPFFKQVVTGADDSSVAVWDIESGAKSMMFSNTHGREEITCMMFDDSWRRLITGARNGTVKVWNVQNGHNLHKMQAIEDAEITGIVPLPERKLILAVGWSRKIILYDDSHPDNMYVKPDITWKGGQVHEEDILATATCPPNLLATASFDGAICVWSLETEKLLLWLRRGQTYKMDSQHLPYLTSDSRPGTRGSSGRPRSRPNSRHRRSHKPPRGAPAPVDKLLFLQARARVKRNQGALLISSEAGVLHWWSIYSSKHELGSFYAPKGQDASILGMCTDSENLTLITGDTHGDIDLWDISQYCLEPEDKKVRSLPPRIQHWHAHDSAIVSVELAGHEHGPFIISASTDRTAKLWSLDGYHIGTFGQKKRWSLLNQQTWAHPPPESERKVSQDETVKPSGAETATDDVVIDITASVNSPEHKASIPGSASTGKIQVTDSPTRQPSLSKAMLKQRSHTFTFGMDRSLSRSKSNLGYKVDNDFARMKVDRQERRETFSDVSIPKASRLGHLCCPYQALTTPEIKDFQLPSNLPVSQRMVSKGLSDGGLTLDSLRTLDLSYYETPSGGEQAALNAKNNGPKTTKLPAIKNKRYTFPNLVKRSKTTLSAFT